MNSTDNGTFSLFCANVTGIESNCIYPNEQPITSKEALEAAVVRDYVVARFKNNYRNTANFVSANCLCKDCDNDSSDNPDEWVTPEDVRRAFPDVPLGIHYSRNHMKPKRGKAPRPKFHCIVFIVPSDSPLNTAITPALRSNIQIWISYLGSINIDAPVSAEPVPLYFAIHT